MTVHASSPLAAAAAQAAANRKRRAWTKKHTIITGSVAGVIALVAIVLVARSRGGPPPLNAPIEQIARFVISPQLKELPFDRQCKLMEVLGDRKDKLAEAYKEKRLTHEEAQQAVNYAWVGNRLGEMRRFYERPEGQLRDEYLTALAQTILRKRGSKSTKATTNPVVVEEEQDGILPKHEQSAEKEIPATWPADVHAQYTIFRSNVAEKVREIQKAQKAKKPGGGKKKNKNTNPGAGTKAKGVGGAATPGATGVLAPRAPETMPSPFMRDGPARAGAMASSTPPTDRPQTWRAAAEAAILWGCLDPRAG